MEQPLAIVLKPLTGRACIVMAWLLGSRLFGQPSDENLWDRTAQIPTGGNVAQAWVQPPVFHPFYLRHAALQPILRAAPNEAAHIILPDIISKEPLSVAVRSGEPGWANIVRWSVFAMIEAEELGLSARNIAARTNEPGVPPTPSQIGRRSCTGRG